MLAKPSVLGNYTRVSVRILDPSYILTNKEQNSKRDEEYLLKNHHLYKFQDFDYAGLHNNITNNKDGPQKNHKFLPIKYQQATKSPK